jgi:ATP-dependent Lon protease
LGAHWAEIKSINLPWANCKDMEHDISLEIYNNMQFEFVCTVVEVLEAAFEH